ncbi:hypothetical protein HBB16_10275 [Pseudonocardia sp. MCCB 268]|nr:hypothetical protein [Pseudonocardia cytotoxica]
MSSDNPWLLLDVLPARPAGDPAGRRYSVTGPHATGLRLVRCATGAAAAGGAGAGTRRPAPRPVVEEFVELLVGVPGAGGEAQRPGLTAARNRPGAGRPVAVDVRRCAHPRRTPRRRGHLPAVGDRGRPVRTTSGRISTSSPAAKPAQVRHLGGPPRERGRRRRPRRRAATRARRAPAHRNTDV